MSFFLKIVSKNIVIGVEGFRVGLVFDINFGGGGKV